MDPYRVKRHDLVPAIQATLVTANNKPMNLGAAVGVRFIMSSEDAGVTIAAPAQILQGVDPTTLAITNEGRVRYAWAPGNTDAIGVYRVEWEINWGNGELQTVPNRGYGELIIQADLG